MVRSGSDNHFLQPFFENFLNYSWEFFIGLNVLIKDLKITFEGVRFSKDIGLQPEI